jgi:uncharacterized protein (DUF362 family)
MDSMTSPPSVHAPGAQIGIVEDYADPRPIRDFFAGVIDADPEIADLLRSADGSRLVVVKPNWIQESHERLPDVWEPVITHPRVVIAVVETLASVMGGRGTICVCDAPHTHADFASIVGRGDLLSEIDALRRAWPRLAIEILDLRREVWIRKEGVVVERRPNPQDPRGYVRLDLGRDSLFSGHRGEGRYYGADYDTSVVNGHHRGDVHEYLLAGSPMACDLFVNLPKLKTHKKTGITCCLKNLVGINGDKNWLPHHTESTPQHGGDEFPDASMARGLEMTLKKAARRMLVAVPGAGSWVYRKARTVGKLALGDSDTVIRNGNWQGNDTCWRMALDLNRALLHGRADGSWGGPGAPRRKYIALVDGILGGQGNGPLSPDPARSRVLLAGRNPGVVDAVAARLMGFDPGDLPIVAGAFGSHRWPIADVALADITVRDPRVGAQDVPLARVEPAVPGGFAPHFGWTALRRSA